MYLIGEAYLFVNNLELTDANYQVAIDELKNMYCKKDFQIDTILKNWTLFSQ